MLSCSQHVNTSSHMAMLTATAHVHRKATTGRSQITNTAGPSAPRDLRFASPPEWPPPSCDFFVVQLAKLLSPSSCRDHGMPVACDSPSRPPRPNIKIARLGGYLACTKDPPPGNIGDDEAAVFEVRGEHAVVSGEMGAAVSRELVDRDRSELMIPVSRSRAPVRCRHWCGANPATRDSGGAYLTATIARQDLARSVRFWRQYPVAIWRHFVRSMTATK